MSNVLIWAPHTHAWAQGPVYLSHICVHTHMYTHTFTYTHTHKAPPITFREVEWHMPRERTENLIHCQEQSPRVSLEHICGDTDGSQSARQVRTPKRGLVG